MYLWMHEWPNDMPIARKLFFAVCQGCDGVELTDFQNTSTAYSACSVLKTLSQLTSMVYVVWLTSQWAKLVQY